MGGSVDFIVKNDVSSDTLVKEVIEEEVVKVEIDREKRTYLC